MSNIADYYEETGQMPEQPKVYRVERARIDTEYVAVVAYIRAKNAEQAENFAEQCPDDIDWEYRKSYGSEASEWSEDGEIDVEETTDTKFDADATEWTPEDTTEAPATSPYLNRPCLTEHERKREDFLQAIALVEIDSDGFCTDDRAEALNNLVRNARTLIAEIQATK